MFLFKLFNDQPKDFLSIKARFEKSAIFDVKTFRWAIDVLKYLKNNVIIKPELAKIFLGIKNDKAKDALNLVMSDMLKCKNFTQTEFSKALMFDTYDKDTIDTFVDINNLIKSYKYQTNSILSFASLINKVSLKEAPILDYEYQPKKNNPLYISEQFRNIRENVNHIPDHIELKIKLANDILSSEQKDEFIRSLLNIWLQTNKGNIVKERLEDMDEKKIELMFKIYTYHHSSIKSISIAPLGLFKDQMKICVNNEDIILDYPKLLFYLDLFIDQLISETLFLCNSHDTSVIEKIKIDNSMNKYDFNMTVLKYLKNVSKDSIILLELRKIISNLPVSVAAHEKTTLFSKEIAKILQEYSDIMTIQRITQNALDNERIVLQDLKQSLFIAKLGDYIELRQSVCKLTDSEGIIINKIIDKRISQSSIATEKIIKIQESLGKVLSFEEMRQRIENVIALISSIEEDVYKEVSNLVFNENLDNILDSLNQMLIVDSSKDNFKGIVNEYASSYIELNCLSSFYEDPMQLTFYLLDKFLGQFWLSWGKNYESRIIAKDARIQESINMTPSDTFIKLNIKNEINNILSMRREYLQNITNMVEVLLSNEFKKAFSKFYFNICFIKHVSRLKKILYGHTNLLDINKIYDTSLKAAKDSAIESGISKIKVRKANYRDLMYFISTSFKENGGLFNMASYWFTLTNWYEHYAEKSYASRENMKQFVGRMHFYLYELLKIDLRNIDISTHKDVLSSKIYESLSSEILNKLRTSDVSSFALEMIFTDVTNFFSIEKLYTTEKELKGVFHIITSEGEKAAINRAYDMLKDDLISCFGPLLSDVGNSGALLDNQIKDFIFNNEIDSIFRENNNPSAMNTTSYVQTLLIPQEKSREAIAFLNSRNDNIVKAINGNVLTDSKE